MSEATLREFFIKNLVDYFFSENMSSGLSLCVAGTTGIWEGSAPHGHDPYFSTMGSWLVRLW